MNILRRRKIELRIGGAELVQALMMRFPGVVEIQALPINGEGVEAQIIGKCGVQIAYMTDAQRDVV